MNAKRIETTRAGARAGRAAARRRAQALRGRHVDELPRHPGAARSRAGAGPTSWAPCSPTICRSSISRRCRKRPLPADRPRSRRPRLERTPAGSNIVCEMNRRDFLRSTLISASGLAFVTPRPARAFADDGWRTFELTTRIDVQKPAGATRVWMPTPLTVETPYQQTLGNTFHADGGTASFTDDRAFGTGIVRAEWPEGATPTLVVVSRVRTRDYAVDLDARPARHGATTAELRRFLEPVPLIPTSGIVKETATQNHRRRAHRRGACPRDLRVDRRQHVP